MGAVDFLAKPLSPLKLRNIWQHTDMNIDCRHSKPARAASAPVPKAAAPLPSKPSKAGSVAPLLPWGLVTCQSDDEESSDLDDVAPAVRCVTGESAPAAANAAPARGSGGRLGRVHSCPSTRSLQSTSSSRSSMSVAVVPGSPGAKSATPTAATPQTQLSSESSGEDGAAKKVIRRAVRHLPAPALASSRPMLKPGASTGMPAPQQQQQQQQAACAVPVPLPTGLGPLPSGMVWGMPMTTLARAPGITPPVMPSPMAWGPMGAMCAPAGMCPPPMMGMPMGAVGPVCPPPGFPAAISSFAGMVPCSAGPNGVPVGSNGSSAAPASGPQKQQKKKQVTASRSASAPTPFSLSSTPLAASDAATTAEAALNAIASLDFEFQADDDVVGDVDELMAQIDLKPDCCELGTSASLPGASCLALEPEELAAACSGDGSLGGGVCSAERAMSSCAVFGECSPESSEDMLTRCDSASVLPSLESLFGLQGDECSSDLLPPLDAPLGLCLKKTGSLADMINEGLAIHAA